MSGVVVAYAGFPYTHSLPFLTSRPPHQPGCKRLHPTISPSQRAGSSGRPKTQILSGVRGRGCVRRASSSRPRAHRRHPRPTAWSVGRAWSGPAVPPAQTGLHSRVVCGSLTLSSRFITLPAYLATPAHPGRPPHADTPHSTHAGSTLTTPLLPHHPLPSLPHSSPVPPHNCPAASACI